MPARPRLVVSRGKYASENSPDGVQAHGPWAVPPSVLKVIDCWVASRPFIFKVEIILPTQSTLIPSSSVLCPSAKDPGLFFYAASATFNHFISSEFLTPNIGSINNNITKSKRKKKRQGMLSLLSLGWVDRDDTMCVCRDGKLVIRVGKDTHETLGLEGSRKGFETSQHSNTWVTTVNITSPSFSPGNFMYDRLQWCFGGDRTLPVDVLLCRESPGNSGTGWTLPIQFPKDISYLKRVVPRCYRCFDYNTTLLPSPNLLFTSPSTENLNDVEKLYANSFFDIIGAIHGNLLSIVSSCDPLEIQNQDRFLGQYDANVPLTPSSATTVSWSGLIPHSFIRDIMIEMYKLVASQSPTNITSWGVVSVMSHEDASVGEHHRSHDRILGGEGMFSFVFVGDHDYIVYRAKGDSDL